VDSAGTVEEMKGRFMRAEPAEREAESKNQAPSSTTEAGFDFFEKLVSQDEGDKPVVPVPCTKDDKPRSGVNDGSVAVVNGIRLPPNFVPLSTITNTAANTTANITTPAPCVHTTTPCPSLPPCSFSPWTRWSDCSTTCGPGVRERHRQVSGDHKCIGAFKEEEECGQDSVCPTTTTLPPTTTTSTTEKEPITAVGPNGEIVDVFPNGTVVGVKAPCVVNAPVKEEEVNATTTAAPRSRKLKSPLSAPSTTTMTTPSECQADRNRIFYQEMMKSHYKGILERQPCNYKPPVAAVPRAPLAAPNATRMLRLNTTTEPPPSAAEAGPAPCPGKKKDNGTSAMRSLTDNDNDSMPGA